MNKSFPENKEILAELNKIDDLKKFMKKAMPFASYLKVSSIRLILQFKPGLIFIWKKEQVSKKGLSALNSTLDFDEFQLIDSNSKYLQNTLQVSLLIFLIIVICFFLIIFND